MSTALVLRNTPTGSVIWILVYPWLGSTLHFHKIDCLTARTGKICTERNRRYTVGTQATRLASTALVSSASIVHPYFKLVTGLTNSEAEDGGKGGKGLHQVCSFDLPYCK